MQISDTELSKARELCTPAELLLIEASHGPALEKMSAANLKKKVALTRELRDKWRDLFTQQRRQVQRERGARASAENARSQEKSDLFANALVRFEGQLARAASSAKSGGAKSARPTSARSSPSKRSRVQEHRLTRARTKEQLEERRAAMEREKKTEPTPEAARSAKRSAEPTASEQAASERAPVREKATAAAASPQDKQEGDKAPSPASPRGKKALAAKTLKKSVAKPKLLSRAKLTKNILPFSEQPSASAAAKRTRIKVSGLNTRTRGHVSARGKRAQARRDSKS